MSKILKFGNTPKYKLTCRNCKTVAEYDKWELNEYEDCYDCECVEFRCPVCRKFTSIYKNDLNKYKVVEDKIKNNIVEDVTNKNEETNKRKLTIFQKLQCYFRSNFLNKTN